MVGGCWIARWGPRGRASDIFAYPSRHGGAREAERERERGEGEGVPGGHALSLYNVVSFEKFPSRKNSPPETSSVRSLVRLTLPVPRAGEGGARSTPPYVINGGRLLQRGTLALLTGRC